MRPSSSAPSSHTPRSLDWSQHGQEWIGKRGKMIVAFVICEKGGGAGCWNVYHPDESNPDRPGSLAYVSLLTFEDAVTRAEGM